MQALRQVLAEGVDAEQLGSAEQRGGDREVDRGGDAVVLAALEGHHEAAHGALQLGQEVVVTAQQRAGLPLEGLP